MALFARIECTFLQTTDMCPIYVNISTIRHVHIAIYELTISSGGGGVWDRWDILQQSLK